MADTKSVASYRALAAMVSNDRFTVESICEEADVSEPVVRLLINNHDPDKATLPSEGRQGAPRKVYWFAGAKRAAISTELASLFNALSRGSFARHDAQIPERSVSETALSAATYLLDEQNLPKDDNKRTEALDEASNYLKIAQKRLSPAESSLRNQIRKLQERVSGLASTRPAVAVGTSKRVAAEMAGAGFSRVRKPFKGNAHVILSALTESTSPFVSFVEGALMTRFVDLHMPLAIQRKPFEELLARRLGIADFVYLVVDTSSQIEEEVVVDQIRRIYQHATRGAHLCVIDSGHSAAMEEHVKELPIGYHSHAKNYQALAELLDAELKSWKASASLGKYLPVEVRPELLGG